MKNIFWVKLTGLFDSFSKLCLLTIFRSPVIKHRGSRESRNFRLFSNSSDSWNDTDSDGFEENNKAKSCERSERNFVPESSDSEADTICDESIISGNVMQHTLMHRYTKCMS